jgi:hypothetical protein
VRIAQSPPPKLPFPSLATAPSGRAIAVVDMIVRIENVSKIAAIFSS